MMRFMQRLGPLEIIMKPGLLWVLYLVLEGWSLELCMRVKSLVLWIAIIIDSEYIFKASWRHIMFTLIG